MDEKMQKAIDIVKSKGYSLLAAIGIVKQYGADKILEEAANPETSAPPPPPPPKQSKSHAPEAGAVGKTGAHGDLGTNAKS
jgi:hypothetical protein